MMGSRFNLSDWGNAAATPMAFQFNYANFVNDIEHRTVAPPPHLRSSPTTIWLGPRCVLIKFGQVWQKKINGKIAGKTHTTTTTTTATLKKSERFIANLPSCDTIDTWDRWCRDMPWCVYGTSNSAHSNCLRPSDAGDRHHPWPFSIWHMLLYKRPGHVVRNARERCTCILAMWGESGLYGRLFGHHRWDWLDMHEN